MNSNNEFLMSVTEASGLMECGIVSLGEWFPTLRTITLALFWHCLFHASWLNYSLMTPAHSSSKKEKVKCTLVQALRLCTGRMAHRGSWAIALLFHDRGTRRAWVVSSTPRPHFTPEKDPVPILQEAGWAPGPVSTGGKSRPHRDSIPDRPARSQSLYWLRYLAHVTHPSSNHAQHCLTAVIGQEPVFSTLLTAREHIM